MNVAQCYLLIQLRLLLLTIDMLLHSNSILQLMKQQVDELLAQDQQLQIFLTWVSQKARAVPAKKSPVTLRAFYFDLAFARALTPVGGTLDLARAFNNTITCNLETTLALDLALDRTLALDVIIDRILDPQLVFERVLERAVAHACVVDPCLERSLQQLKEQLPDLGEDKEKFKQWWKTTGGAWSDRLRSVIIEYRHLGYDWQFSAQQKDALKQYYEANQLLVNCLNSDRYTTSTVREEIENTLLLPIAEISSHIPH